MSILRLTQFSPGAGCGCKISPAQLTDILSHSTSAEHFPGLLVGYDSRDDAAVFDLGNEKAIISTTDFFTPIVDDPGNFGRIAATNAMSDIYAMGGHPLLAISILGWPLEKLPAETAGLVVNGAREVCSKAHIPLAGGHSIDISDPIFGLAVTGIIEKKNLKKNATATPDCQLFLTKPLGIGVIATAEKKGLVQEEHRRKALDLMLTLNQAGEQFGPLPYVTAMTDVTGFGLGGHLLEMCESSGVDAEVHFSSLPLLNGMIDYIRQKAVPGGTHRNFKSYGDKLSTMDEERRMIICDPQTSGGLLVAVNQSSAGIFQDFCRQSSIPIYKIGRTMATLGNQVRVNIID